MAEMTTVEHRCPICGEVNSVEMPTDKWEAWMSGAPIQVAWPDSTPEQREAAMTGLHAHHVTEGQD